MPRKILTRFGVNQFRWFILIALLPLTIAGTACYFFVRGQIRQDVFNELQVEAWGIKNNIASILGENLARIVDFSSDGYIRDSARALLLPVEKADIVRQNLNRHLKVNKKSLDPDIVEVFIVGTTGKIVASTSSGQIGKDVSAKQYFIRPFLHFEQTGPVFSRETVPTDDVGEPDIVFSALLTDKHLHTPIGVIGNRISTDVLLNTVTSVPNVSGDKEKSANHSHIHILNKDRFILATSSGRADLHSKKAMDTSVIERAFAENRSVIDTYKNPSGHWVLGVAVPVKETGWVILAERDYDIAFAPLARIRNLFIILNCSTALMAFLVAFFVSRNLSADIRKLKDGTETVARGDLDHKIELKRKDELKDLSLSFNTMTGRLKEYTEQVARRGEEVLESEKKYRTLVENLPQKIFYKDKNSVYVSCNDNYARDLKIKPDEIVGKTDYEFYPKELAEKYRADDKRIMASGETEDIEEKYVRDGKECIVYTVKTPVRNEKGVTIGILGIFWDITRRKRMEEELKRTQKQLFQAEKKSSLGTLASGIAHEVNNPLSYTINNIELIKDYIGDITSVEGERLDKEKLFHTLEEIQKCLDDTRAGTEQIRRIISAVYEFSHPGHDRLDYIDINATIEVALNVVWHEIKQKAKVIKDYGELPKILCYPQYLIQVFTNLFLNAVHAIPESGEIHVKTYRQGERVCVEISDTGVGIPEEDLKRIFDPFFTTKEVGKGTGLGLSIVYNLVTKAEGNIEVTSGVGEGTTFKITLPLRTKSDTSSSGHGHGNG